MKSYLVIFFGVISLVLPAQQYRFTNFSLNDGLPQSQVFALLEDLQGYIWMGTNGGGLARFDGIEFTTYNISDGLSGNYILSLHQDKTGKIWVGTSKGLDFYDGQYFKSFQLPENLAVQEISEDCDGRLWLGTNKGVFILQDNQVSKVLPGEFETATTIINFIAPSPDSAMWIGTNRGVFITRNQKLVKRITTREGLPDNNSFAIAFDDTGTAYIGTYGKGAVLVSNGIIRDINLYTRLYNTVISDIYSDGKGLIWFATSDGGLCRYNPADSSAINLSETDGLANNNVKCILQDRWENYWIGTSGGGVSKYAGQQFEQFTRFHGLPGSYIYSIAADHSNKLWTGTSGGGITSFDGERFVHYGVDSGFTNTKVRALYVDSDSLLWVGMEGNGLAIFDGQEFEFYNVSNGLAGNWVKCIREDQNGTIWAASAGGGITLFAKNPDQGYTLTRITSRDGLISNRVTYLHIDQEGRVWYITQHSGMGVIINDSTIKNFTSHDGLSSDHLRSLAEDQFGNLWIAGTSGLDAIYLYNDSLKIVSLPAEWTSSGNIYLLQADHENNIWVGTEKGLDRLKVDSNLNVLESDYFGPDDGFIGVETNLNASCMDRENQLWFGTINGLHKYLSKSDVRNLIAPVLNFRGINLEYVPISETQYGPVIAKYEAPEFRYDENQISFDFIGISQSVPKEVTYKWKLVGLDENWSPVSKRNSVTYSNLPPGTYQFQVLSANEDKVWNEEPLAFDFMIARPIWKETWFIVVTILAGLLMIWIITTLRIRTLKRKAIENQRRLSMERDLISLEQKALRLQMNPHFIFHTLNSIQGLIATRDEETARNYLSRFSKLMRQILENSRSDKISLETEIDTLSNYLSIEQFCHDGQFEFQINYDQDLETEFIMIPPMILQPFVENAIIHGIRPLKAKGRIIIEFQEDGDHIVTTIFDNGVGRTEASKRQKDHDSTALKVTAERLALLNSGAEGISIEDLFDEGRPSGTKVIVTLPIIV